MNILELDKYNLDDAVKFHSRLNPGLWDSNENLRPEVRTKLLEIAADFQEFLGIDDLEVADITISGSNAAYSYTPNSDIDLHLVVDKPEMADQVYQELFNAKKYQYNDTHDIKIRGADVELYVQLADQPQVSQGVYSVRDGQWLKIPRRIRADVDMSCVQNKTEDLEQRAMAAIASGDHSVQQKLWDKIKTMRRTGLAKHGEFGCENLVFKMLRSHGIMKQLSDAMAKSRDRELSLTEKKRSRKFRWGFGGYWYPGFGYGGEGGDGGGGESVREGHQGQPYSSEDGVAATTQMFLNETDSDEQMLRDFIEYTAQQLGIEKMPSILFHRDDDWGVENRSFGRYDPEAHELHVNLAGRHVMDVLRTTAHELAHCRQHELSPLPDDAGSTGSPWENQAHATAGVIMRHWADRHPELFDSDTIEESASGYIPKNRREAEMPQYAMALSVDIQPGEVGRQANKLGLKTGRNGEPGLLMKSANLRESRIRDLNNPPGPETPPTMPAGTVRVDVSDVYDWYKLGQHISNMKGLGRHDFGKGPPSTILSFGDEDLEHQYIQALKQTGLDTTDIDPQAHDVKQGQKTDPTYNVAEAFDQPYKLKWEKGDYGDWDALAQLDDGTYLSIMFNSPGQKGEPWTVEFFRNNSQEVTGEGDAQRVFATVLFAIRQFIKKKKPVQLFFSSIKHDDPTGSRKKLYSRLVQKFAGDLGYAFQQIDYSHQVGFKFTRIGKPTVTEGATVTRIDSKLITDFASNLKSYKHTDDWSQSGLDTGDDSWWKDKNLKPSTSKGLFAGDPKRTALYATGNAHETRYVEFSQDGQPIVYFDRKDLPAMRGRKTYLTVFDASNFKKLPTGEWFSENPGKPIKQTEIEDPFKYIADQGWIIRITDDLPKVFKQVKKMHKAGKIAHYGAEGMNESVQGVAEGTFNKCFDEACELYDKAVEKDLNPILYQVADYKGDGSNADSRWAKLPQHVWSHYVTVIGDTVYDPTAKQFGPDKSEKYNINQLEKEWGKIYKIRPREQGVAEGRLHEFDYNKHVKMLNAYMKKLGYSYIGHGTDAHVFAKEQGTVIKVLIPRDGDISTAKNPFLAFLSYCEKNAGNPHLPKFKETTKEPIQLGSEKFEQVVMERLQEVDPKYEDMLVSMIDSIEEGKPLDPQYNPYAKFYQTLKAVMLTGNKLGFENDILTFQSANIMQRGNTLVITDPWVAGYGQQGVAEGLEYEREPLYHATLKAFEPSIMKSGLLPGGNLRMFDWSDSKFVYLSNYPDIARDFIDPGVIEPDQAHEEQIFDLMKQGGVILKIDQNKLNTKLLSADPHFSTDADDGAETYIYSGVIPPSAIIGKEYFSIIESEQGLGQDLVESLRQEFELMEDELLGEIKMSPTNLRREAAQTGALAGMEFEMIVPGVKNDDPEMEPDYDQDERCRSIEDAVNFFDDGDHNSRSDVRRLQNQMQTDFGEWLMEKIDEDWANDPEEHIYEYLVNNLDSETIGKIIGEDLSDADGVTKQQAAAAATIVNDNRQQPYYDDARDFHREENNDAWDESDWLDDQDLDRMSGVEDRYAITWPHWTYNEGESADIDTVATDFSKAVGMPVNASQSYHGGRREAGHYVVEPDGSLQGDSDDDMGLEFVSPPMPIDEMLDQLKKVREWAGRYGCYTNESTGLHINVSVPDYSLDRLDFVKLALLLGDEYVLDQFGRSSNTYARSALGIVRDKIQANPQAATQLLNKMKGHMEDLASKAIHSGQTSKYTSINTKDGYIEFRSPGGDWLDENFDKVENTLLRFVVAMKAAMDPQAYRKEYLSKLRKLLEPVAKDSAGLAGRGTQDTVKYFADYVAGKIPAAALRSFVKQAQLQRKIAKDPTGGQKYWWQVGLKSNPSYSIEVVGNSRDEAVQTAIDNTPAWQRFDFKSDDFFAKPIRPYEQGSEQQPTSSSTPPPVLNGRPSNPDGNAYIAALNDLNTPVYRFMAANGDDARTVLDQWDRAYGGNWAWRPDPRQERGQPAIPGSTIDLARRRAAAAQSRSRTLTAPESNPDANYAIVRNSDQAVIDYFTRNTQGEAERSFRIWLDQQGTDESLYTLASVTPRQSSQSTGNNRLWQIVDSANGEVAYEFYLSAENNQQDANEVGLRWVRNNGDPTTTYSVRERTEQTGTVQPQNQQWRILIDGEEVHRFWNRNNQGEANAAARQWMGMQMRQGALRPAEGAEIEVVPVMTNESRL